VLVCNISAHPRYVEKFLYMLVIYSNILYIHELGITELIIYYNVMSRYVMSGLSYGFSWIYVRMSSVLVLRLI